VYASQRWFDLYLKAIFIGGKLEILGFTLGFPILIYADVAIIYSTIFSAIGFKAAVQLPLILAMSYTFIFFPLYLYLTTYKGINWIITALAIIYYLTNRISQQEHSFTPTSILVYKSIYLCYTLFNEVVSFILIFLKFVVIAVTCVGFTLCLLNGISIFSLSLVTISIILLFSLNIFMYMAGHVCETSQECIQKWKGTVGLSALNLKTLASLRHCRFQVGSQYYVDRGVLPKLNSAVVENVISTALAFQ